MSKIGINGFGRIGRLVLRAALLKGAEVCMYRMSLQYIDCYYLRLYPRSHLVNTPSTLPTPHLTWHTAVLSPWP